MLYNFALIPSTRTNANEGTACEVQCDTLQCPVCCGGTTTSGVVNPDRGSWDVWVGSRPTQRRAGRVCGGNYNWLLLDRSQWKGGFELNAVWPSGELCGGAMWPCVLCGRVGGATWLGGMHTSHQMVHIPLITSSTLSTRGIFHYPYNYIIIIIIIMFTESYSPSPLDWTPFMHSFIPSLSVDILYKKYCIVYINYMITSHMMCGIYIEMELGTSSQTVG